MRLSVAIGPILSVVLAQAAGAQALTLSQALDEALVRHPLVTAAQLGMDRAREREAQTRAERGPRVDVSETVSHGNNPVFVFGSLLEQAEFGPSNFALDSLNNPSSITNFRSAVSANLTLYDGRKTAARLEQASMGRDMALLGNNAVQQQVRFEVLQSYLGLLLAEAAVGVSEDALRTGESDVKRARDRVDAGLSVTADLLAAQVQLAEFRQERIEAESRRTTALAALNVSMGAPPNVPRTLSLRLEKKDFEVLKLDQLLAKALLHRPEYVETGSRLEIADSRIEEERAAHKPEIRTFASIGASGRNPVSGSVDYAVGASVTLSVLDRGLSAKVAQAEIDKRFVEADRIRIADKIRLEVISAYQRYRAGEQQVDVAEAALTQALEGLRIVQDRYEAGLTTITELLRAETAVARARFNRFAALHGHYLGYATILFSTGELTDVQRFEQ